jgi:hypothetical protein
MIFKAWHFHLIFAYYRQAPTRGRETFLPGGRPPVNVSCKGGRSPNSERVRDTLLVGVPKGVAESKTYCMGDIRHERTNHYMSTLQG